jgi:hypothetical protein
MILSFAHNFVFIKTIKTASSSIEVALSQLCTGDDVVTALYPEEPSHRPRNFASLGFSSHMPASIILAKIGAPLWRRLFKCTVERNPWDKICSWYAWQKHLCALDEPFCEFVELCNGRNRWPYLFPASSELYSLNGEICVDYIMRYERLNEDFDTLFAGRFGLPRVALPRAKSGHRDRTRSYREYYSRRCKALVAERYAFEVANLGYTF